jgi:hypothetical protein
LKPVLKPIVKKKKLDRNLKPIDQAYLNTLTRLDPDDKKQCKIGAAYPAICVRCNSPFKNHNEYKLHIKSKQCDVVAVFASDQNPEEAMIFCEPSSIQYIYAELVNKAAIFKDEQMLTMLGMEGTADEFEKPTADELTRIFAGSGV